MNDERVMQAVRSGDAERLGTLFERHHVALYEFLYRTTGDASTAEDLVQDVFVRILKYRHTYRDGYPFLTWMYRIARNAPPPTNDLVNTFERVIERTQPELVAHYAAYSAAGAPRLHLCGAGPAVFLLVTEGAKIAELQRDFGVTGATVIEAHTLPRAASLRIERLTSVENRK